MSTDIQELVSGLYRQESGRVLATMIRQCGDIDLAEDAVQETFTAALTQWQRDGVPSNPTAWLFTAARFKLIDALRRRRPDLAIDQAAEAADPSVEPDWSSVEDDSLRLVFMCCHPSLSFEAQVALTLREVCGLTTEEIARAFLVTPTSLAQRIVRAKARLREGNVPFGVPEAHELRLRLDAVCKVVYLVFNEGYYATSGESVTRVSLSEEAIRLGRIVTATLPDPEVVGLLALMLIQESRRAARTDEAGDVVLLEDQDRGKWDGRMTAEGLALAERALETGEPGPYALQAAIAAVHMQSPSSAETDWGRVVELYDALLRIHPSSVVELNRAVAVAMSEGLEVGLGLIDRLLERGGLADYGLAHAARADLCRRLGRRNDARAAYGRALELATQEPERRFLSKRLREVS